VRIAYADPPYIGCAHLYPEKQEVDHEALLAEMVEDFDAFVLHAAATPESFDVLAPLVADIKGARWCAWVKGFAAFKKNVPVAYAWEPVIIKTARKPVVSKRLVMRDWIECPITLRRGMVGAKPEKVCHWAFELVGARPGDDLIDLFPGTGAVTRAWKSWRRQLELPAMSPEEARAPDAVDRQA